VLMNWNEELKHWSANDDLGISRYRAFQLTKNQVHPGSLSFRIIERRAAHRNRAVSRSRLLFTAHKSNMSASAGPSAIMPSGKLFLRPGVTPDALARALALRALLFLAGCRRGITRQGDRETARQLGRSTIVVEFLIALQPFLLSHSDKSE
jgi:hypothetical protein